MRIAIRSILATIVVVLAARTTLYAEPVRIFVATDGNDGWSGKKASPNPDKTDGPLATLAGARDLLREMRQQDALPEGATVEVGEGTYIFGKPLQFSGKDSGTKEAPIVFRAATEKQVRLLGGKIVTEWKRVEDPKVLDRLDPSARDHVVSTNLKELGVTDFGSPSINGLELFFDSQPMTLARWPNTGFAKITGVLGKTQHNVRGTKGCREGIFTFDGDRPQRWVDEQDAWVHGYWFWDWSEQRHKIKSIDTEQHSIEVQPPYHGYGYRKGQWFYGFNLLSEIDQPGEWYLDRDEGTLYLWPPSPVEQSEAIVSVTTTIIKLEDVSHVTWKGFLLEGGRGTGIAIDNGSNVRVEGCTIRNVGGWAVHVSGGTGHSVVGCDMYQMGQGGIVLTGGNLATLEPGGHRAENNHIHHYARVTRVYRPGISLNGVGNIASHNLIHNAPHMGMGFLGNDHTIEFNEIHSVCYESNDAGAIYTGRRWTMRGTVVRYNYMHHINGFEDRGCVGVYLDDMFCGTEISGNLFYRVTRPAFIGGGRDCVVKNNLFVDCDRALHIDARALGWAHDHSDTWIKEGQEKETLHGIRYLESPYKDRYPELVNILEDEPAAPKGNRIFHNVSFGGKWDDVTNRARPYQTIENNFVDQDPSFATPQRIGDGKDPRAVDFSLKPDSPAWAVGFKKLPLEQMGLYKDEARASWPVTHTIRRMVP